MDIKKTITESQLRQIVNESVKKVLNEISFRTVADAAAAAADRERNFPPDIPSEDLVPKHYNNGQLDVDRYERDVEHTRKTRQYPQKFRKEAFRRLYQELFGVDELYEADPKEIQSKSKELTDGIQYILNNETKYNWK